METNKRHRDRRLRRAMLVLLYETRGTAGGWIGGQLLVDLYGSQSMRRERCEDEAHQAALLHDLILKEVADVRDARVYKHEKQSLETSEYRITAKGVSLIDETIPADPDIEDQRITK